MRRYRGVRCPENRVSVTVEDRQGVRCLDPRFDIWKHSPTGFEWGYPGSGPAQLALALLANALKHDGLAEMFHQQYKADVIQHLVKSGWVMDAEEILLWFVREMAAELCEDESEEEVQEGH